MKEGKITVVISIACTAFILGLIMFAQFKTVDETDITAIETMRETELRTELANWKEKYEEVEAIIEDREAKIAEYNEELSNDQVTSNALENEVKEAQTYLGYTDVQGEGIIITLEDGESEITYSDLLTLVNELKAAGAEAISINDERIISKSDITQVNNRIILVNSKKMSGPYVVKAIGSKKYFESALSIKGGFIDEIKAYSKKIEYEVQDNIIINAYKGDEESFEYAKENN